MMKRKALLVVVAVFAGLFILGSILRATGYKTRSEIEQETAETAPENVETQKASEPEPEPEAEAKTEPEWILTNNTSNPVTLDSVTDDGILLTFGTDGLGSTGYFTKADVNGQTYTNLEDPNCPLKFRTVNNGVVSDSQSPGWDAANNRGISYDATLLITMPGFSADDYKKVVLTCDDTTTRESAWDGTNKVYEFKDETIVIALRNS